MANPEHLAILKQGIETWNTWRTAHPDVRRPDLSEADFTRAQLFGANLYAAILSEAHLTGANLRGSNLVAADLIAANLRCADLRGVDLSLAFLHSADLRGANLAWAIFKPTSIRGANLAGCRVGDTLFGDVDLSGVAGLDEVIHDAPSTIGIDTLYRSKGHIPDVFLRGCGVPEPMIEYARSLVTTPIQYYSCFISYSSQDEALARRLHADLRAAGVRVWFAPHDMPIGARVRPTIHKQVRAQDKLLLVLSASSLASQWVEDEVETALAKERAQNCEVLFPIRLDDAVMKATAGWAASLRNTRHIGDFTHWQDPAAYQAAFALLLRDLQATP